MRRQSTKSISFFMELMIVIFFFTLAAGICVLVMGEAKKMYTQGDDIKKALLYAQNMIEQNDPQLYKASFRMNDAGAVSDTGVYEVSVKKVKQGRNGMICELHIQKGVKELVVLNFYQLEEDNAKR